MTKSFQQAKASLADAELLIAGSNYKEANRVLDIGLSALGYSYASPSVDDDTGLKLAAALSEERAGHLDTAAHMRANVLRTRLTLCSNR